MRKEAGCKFESQGTNHEWWVNPNTGERFQVPKHKTQEVKARTLHSILKAAGIRK
nr:type II toxin-antitoxin system HicA family toxin [Schwartzia sp. (in: firmicutes)]